MLDLADAWSTHGADVLARVAKVSPEAFFSVCARLCPANVQLSIEQQFSGGLTPDDLAILRAIKESDTRRQLEVAARSADLCARHVTSG